MESSIFRFIVRYSLRQQIIVLVMTAASWPILYMTLELPKRIVNEALGGKEGWARNIFGPGLDQITFLLALSFLFLFFVLVNGAQKYYLNVYAGRMGEQMLRRLRYQLYANVLRFPLPQFKKVSQGEIIPMITAETEPVGGFIGEAFAIPAFQGGMLMVYLVFIFVQDPLLGAAAVALYPVQIWVIPKMQARVNRLAKERVRTTRQLSDKIGESISGIGEIRAHDATRFERADVARRLNKIYEIRYEIFRRKFAIKFLNNFLAQLTPFFFYAIGGYLVIRALQTDDPSGLTLGALVAVLAAYKDLSSPWKELLNYYQQLEDVRIKYEQVVEQFAPQGMIEPTLQDAEPDPKLALAGQIAAANLSYSEDGRVKAVEAASFTVPLDKPVAIVGAGASGKEELTLMLARLVEPSGGSLTIGGAKAAALPESVTGRRLAYVGPSPYLFATTVRENLFYGLKHRPGKAPERDAAGQRLRQRYVANSEAAGNIVDDPEADWIDYPAAAADSPDALERRALDTLGVVDMAEDMYQLGLRGTIDPKADPDLAAAILKARTALRERLARDGQSDLVEPFDARRYNDNATLGENLLFGTPRDQRIDVDRLADHAYVQKVLAEASLSDTLLATGRQLAETMVELFAGLAPGNELFEQYSFIKADDLPEYQALLARTAKQAPADYRGEDRQRLLSLPFRLVPARHRLGLITDDIKAKVLEARGRFRDRLPADLADAVELFDAAAYNGASTLLDNVLFGKIAYGQAQAQQKINRIVFDLLEEMHLRDDVMIAGLDFHVGVAGARLSTAQRQKLGIARAVIKRPDLLILNESFNSLDGAAQQRLLASLLAAFAGRGIVCGLQRARLAKDFAHVIVMRGGRIVEQGRYDELAREGTELGKLIAAE
jgi:ABC-type multidrug transport system fused ATPase/permease subunit